MNRQHPETFFIPDTKDKAGLKLGDVVKIGLYPKSGMGLSERFWVIIIHREGKSFTGIIDNDLWLTDFHGYKDGDEIVFNKDNVLDIYD